VAAERTDFRPKELAAMTIYWMRLSAIAIAALVALGLRDETIFGSAVTSIGFGHYLLSIWYARTRLSGLSRDRQTAAATLAAVVAGGLLYGVGFPLIVYFAAHHVCNEAYITAGISDRLRLDRRRQLRTTAIVLHSVLYFTLLRSEFADIFVRRGYIASAADIQQPTLYFFIPLIVAYIAYFATLFRVRDELSRRSLLELSVLEIAGLVLLAVSFVTPIRFLDVVCYHFVFWWFYPASKLAQRGTAAVLQYAAWMVILIAGTFSLSPAVIPDYPFRGSIYLKQFLLWSHIHITSSFFLSSAHPEWIRRWFMPGQRAQAPATA
jgi:hypothetical protein